MGGVGPTGRQLTPADAVVLCASCNVEAEGSMQDLALASGWKIPRSCPTPADRVPYRDALTGNWWLPDVHGDRTWVDDEQAEAMIRAALADR